MAAEDMSEVFSKTGMEKVGSGSMPESILAGDPAARTVQVSAKCGKRAA